jgi:RimJ/RimL family protein N-acetyltransferase
MRRFDQVMLDTPRLRLRPLIESDAEALLAVCADPDVMMYSNIPCWTSIDQAFALIERDRKGMSAGRHLCLGIVPATEGRVVGTCTVFDIFRGHRRAEVGFLLGTFAWGKGYMTESLTAVLDYIFSALDLNRIEADIDPRNRAAARVLERLGFVREGLLRERWIVEGQKSDSALYGLLRNEWRSSQ